MTEQEFGVALQKGLERGEKLLRETIQNATTTNDFNCKMSELYGIGIYILANDVMNTKNLREQVSKKERLQQIMGDIVTLVNEPVSPEDIETYKIPEQSEAF